MAEGGAACRGAIGVPRSDCPSKAGSRPAASLPESPVRNGREIELQLALGLCLYTAKGAVEAKPPYTRAHELAEESGEPQQRFEALYGVWQSTNTSGGSAAASPLSDRLLRMAELEGDDGLRLQAHHSGWTTWGVAGDPAKALEHADVGRLLYDPEKHASHRLVYGGHDPGVCAGCHSARAEWLLGYPEKALANAAESLVLAERIAHPFTLGVALCSCSVVYLNRREPERALRLLDAAEALAAEQRLSLTFEPSMLRGAALLGQGAVDEATARIREGVTNWIRLGRTHLLPYGLAFLAEGLARHGDRAPALAALREGLETARATGEHMWDAELHRLTGTTLLAENKLDEGQALASASDPHRPSPTSEIAGIARRDEPRPAVGRAGPPRRSPRSPRPGLWLVHRGLRHRRSERGKRRCSTTWRELIRVVRMTAPRWTQRSAGEDKKVGSGSRTVGVAVERPTGNLGRTSSARGEGGRVWNRRGSTLRA